MKKLSGFSIVEILIVMLIMGLFIGVGYVNFRDFGVRQQLSSAARKLEGDIRYAQELSFTQVLPEDVNCEPDSFNGIIFRVTSANTYTVFLQCLDDKGFYEVELKNYTIDNPNIFLNVVSSESSVVFNILGRGTNAVPITGYNIDICMGDLGVRTIVTGGGSINQNEEEAVCPPS